MLNNHFAPKEYLIGIALFIFNLNITYADGSGALNLPDANGKLACIANCDKENSQTAEEYLCQNKKDVVKMLRENFVGMSGGQKKSAARLDKQSFMEQVKKSGHSVSPVDAERITTIWNNKQAKISEALDKFESSESCEESVSSLKNLFQNSQNTNKKTDEYTQKNFESLKNQVQKDENYSKEMRDFVNKTIGDSYDDMFKSQILFHEKFGVTNQSD